MTNSLAVILGVLILGAIGVDYVLFGTEHVVFLGKKFFVLLHWLAFWH